MDEVVEWILPLTDGNKCSIQFVKPPTHADVAALRQFIEVAQRMMEPLTTMLTNK